MDEEVEELFEEEVDELVEIPDEVDVEDEVAPDEVELDDPPVEDVELISILIPLLPDELPLPELPKKPPAKNPPTKPPPVDPPITPDDPPPELPVAISPIGGGRGMGAPWLVTVTTAGAHWAWVVVTVRRTTRLGAVRATVRRTTRFLVTTFFATCARGLGLLSTTCTAPPPTSAPPQAHAQSFAKAMRTDMIVPLFPLLARDARRHVQRIAQTE